jgi:hypothetical protein
VGGVRLAAGVFVDDDATDAGSCRERERERERDVRLFKEHEVTNR